MKLSGGPSSVRLKILLLAVALIIGSATLLYTNYLITKLQDEEKKIVNLIAKAIEFAADPSESSGDITFVFEHIIRPKDVINFPLILTDSKGNVNLFDSTSIRNIEFEPGMNDSEKVAFLEMKKEEFAALNTPFEIRYIAELDEVEGMDTIILNKLYYGDSPLITQLKYYPYLQLIIAALFILVAYISFSQIKKSEQSNIWVGMAKETAHQYGTPLSSLMGWLELLKMNYDNPDKVLDAAEEIEADIEKLSKITNRFSKIGAKGELAPVMVYAEVSKVVEYFKRRLPQTGKRVELLVAGTETVQSMLNADLFEWVIENLIKNALDAIDHDHGRIEITVLDHKKRVEIDVKDNGKGFDMRMKNEIFRPGYSTKRRGWGLGLSLSKRIIEVYHSGTIRVQQSRIGEGTTFRILLKKIPGA